MGGVQREDVIDATRGEGGLMGLLGRLGLPATKVGREVRVACPFGQHEDRTPSCGFFQRGGEWCFKCFPCGAGGSVVDFGARMANINPDTEFPRLMEWFGQTLGISAGGDGEAGGISEHKRLEIQVRRERAARQAVAIEDKRRADAVRQAVTLWDAAEATSASAEGVAAVRGYFGARGIELDRLPASPGIPWGGAKMIRWHPEVYRSYHVATGRTTASGKPELIRREEEVPAIVCGCCNSGRELVAVQRIYLDPPPPRGGGGRGKIGYGLKPDGKSIMDKATLGSLCGNDRSGVSRGGVTVRLNGRTHGGGLLLCEGIETGMALLAAMTQDGVPRVTVWCCVSAEGLRAFRLSQYEAAWVRSVTVCGDCDRSKAGQRAARDAASNLLTQTAAGEWGDAADWAAWGGQVGGVSVHASVPDERVAAGMVQEMANF